MALETLPVEFLPKKHQAPSESVLGIISRMYLNSHVSMPHVLIVIKISIIPAVVEGRWAAPPESVVFLS